MALSKDFSCDKLRVRIFDSRNGMGECEGAEIAKCIKDLMKAKENVKTLHQ